MNDLDFADDIALLESSLSQAQATLTSTAEAAKELGLIMSVPKREYITANCRPQLSLQVYGEPINHVTDFKYLGSKMASAANDFKAIQYASWPTPLICYLQIAQVYSVTRRWDLIKIHLATTLKRRKALAWRALWIKKLNGACGEFPN